MYLNKNKLYKKIKNIYKYRNCTIFNDKILTYISKKYNNKLNYNVVNIDINIINFVYILDIFYLDNNNNVLLKSFYINIEDISNIIIKINLKRLNNLDNIDRNKIKYFNNNYKYNK